MFDFASMQGEIYVYIYLYIKHTETCENKKPSYFPYTGCVVGILIMVYDNPHVTWVVVHPQLKNH